MGIIGHGSIVHRAEKARVDMHDGTERGRSILIKSGHLGHKGNRRYQRLNPGGFDASVIRVIA